MRDPLYTKRTARQMLVDIMVGQLVRSTVVTTALQNLITAKSLTALDTATFGFVNNAAGSNQCSITSAGPDLTSADLPWTIDDEGKDIFVQGAGVAGATLQTTILAYVSPGAVTLADDASTTVTELTSSAGGVAIWGWSAGITRKHHPIQSAAGDNLDSDLYTGEPLSRFLGGGLVPAGPVTASGLTENTATVLGRMTAGVGQIEEIAVPYKATDFLAQDTAALLGRTTAGIGATEEITVGSGLVLAGGVLDTAAAGINFRARSAVGQALTANVTTMVYELQDFDNIGDNYNPATGIFTAPATGIYCIQAALDTTAVASFLGIFINGTLQITGSGTTAGPSTISGLFSLTALDTVEVRATTNGTSQGGATRNWFSGFLLG